MPAELAAFATEGPGPIAAVWRSRDGKRWRRVGTDSPFSPNPTPGDITASGGRYLVLSSGRSMVVTSRDGERWRKWRAGISRQGGWISRVESLGDGYAAVGSVRTEDADGRRSCCSTAVWESPNGRRWKPWIVAGDDSYLGRIAVLGDRVAVVEGGRMADEFTRPRGGFTRVLDTDGSVEMGFVPDAAGLYGVGVAGGRFIAAGQACEPALWTSKDGLDWTRLAWSGRLPRGADRWYDVHFAADDRRVVIAGSAEVPREERSGRPPKLVDFALSAPLSALDASENDSRDAGSTCVPPPRMPTAQLATEGGQLVTGALVESCWLPPGSEPAARMDCQESEKPTVDDLPMVPVGKGSTQLRLSLADGSPLAAVSVLQHHARGADVTSAERLVDTGTCSPLEDVPFDVEANRVLIVSVTFDCGQGGATYLFRTRAQTVAE